MPELNDPTRGWLGLLSMAAGAALGGWLCAQLFARPTHSPRDHQAAERRALVNAES
jgi:hypothetical protein